MQYIEMRIAVTVSDMGEWVWTPECEWERLNIAKRLLREDFERQFNELSPQSWKEAGENHGHFSIPDDREETAGGRTAGSHAIRGGRTGADA